jgi:hypothetical protein
MRYRPHRGGLAESIAETVNVKGRAGLIAHLRYNWRNWEVVQFSDDQVRVEPYGGDDDRCGWKDVHIVTIDGAGVQGFCEGPAAP